MTLAGLLAETQNLFDMDARLTIGDLDYTTIYC